MMKKYFILIILIFLFSCTTGINNKNNQEYKNDIIKKHFSNSLKIVEEKLILYCDT
jgi:thioredoxin-related protein